MTASDRYCDTRWEGGQTAPQSVHRLRVGREALDAAGARQRASEGV